ncbi:MAG: hypothetical protein WAU36_03985 [Cyclobacteriaceae bacterium]
MIRLSLIILLGISSHAAFCVIKEDTTKVQRTLNYFLSIQSGSLVRFGAIQGASPATFSTSLVNGIRISDRYQVGIGLGLDYYDTKRVVPLFVSIAYDIVRKKNSFFLEMNYGRAYSKSLMEVYRITKSVHGPMVNPNFGYSIRTNKLVVSFITGYKFQRVTDHYSNPYSIYNDFSWPGGGNATTVAMDLSRIVFGIRVGLR